MAAASGAQRESHAPPRLLSGTGWSSEVTRSGATWNTGKIVASLAEFCLHSFGQSRQIDHHAFVCADANLLGSVGRANRELDAPSINLGHLRLAGDAPTGRGGGQMAYVDPCAQRAFACVKVWFDRIERRVLHDHDHDRRCQNRGQRRILETAREMVGQDDKSERTRGPDRYGLHGLSLECDWLE